MKYSIIIPYRDRESHLKILLPKLREKFGGEDYELIISEQNDSNNFQISCVENVGFCHSSGETIILHQVDYIPTDNVSYIVNDVPVLPARRGIFLNDELQPREYSDIPMGYRKFDKEIDPNFYGGVICMKKDHFEEINGLHPGYKGWGNEDEDLRERFKWAGIKCHRNTDGTFYILNHKDNCPSPNEGDRYSDFVSGREFLINKAYQERHIGYKNMKYDYEIFSVDSIENCKWIKSTNYRIEL